MKFYDTFSIKNSSSIIVVGTCPVIKQFLSALGSQALTVLLRRGGMSRARIATESHIA